MQQMQRRCAAPSQRATTLAPARVCHVPGPARMGRCARRHVPSIRCDAVVDAPRRAPSPDPKKESGSNPVPAAASVTVPNTVPAGDALQDLQELKGKIAAARAAMQEYAHFPQHKVDAIFKAAAAAASASRIQLAVMAVEETGMGCMEDKVIKNHFASEFIYNKYKDLKTCGVIEDDEEAGIQKVAEPVGVIAGIVPTTNPTSTAIFKSLLALKTRNAIVMSPHIRAAKSTIAAAKIVRDAAEAAGAPKGLIQWIEKPSASLAGALMRDPGINLILATGGPAMVRAAYESGHPSIGVGAGNTPAVIDETADIEMAVSSILLSKTFDNGVICASEQSLVVVDAVYDEVVAELKKRGAYIMTKAEGKMAGNVIIQEGRLNANVVGQRATKLAGMFGFQVPKNTRVLVGEATEVGRNEPLSFEKLCPVLGLYRVKDWADAVKTARALVTFGGAGHTSVLYTRDTNKQHIADFQNAMETVRILINSPASQGAIGDVFNFHLDPSLTLGCGSWGSTSVSANVGPQHLINIKTTAIRQDNMLWFRVPPRVYFKRGCLELALKELKTCKRAFIVSDPALFQMGMVNKVTEILEPMGVQTKTFSDVEPDPTLATVERAMGDLNSFRPDVIIAVGGGSPMDAAKLMWLMYEHPEISFMDVAARFMDIRKRINAIPPLGAKAQLVAIPSTSGTGSEVTPFAVVTDHTTGIKYPLADYSLTPNMAICDANLVMEMPRKLTAYGGLDALVHAMESYVSSVATDYTRGMSMQAIKLLFKYLPRAYHNGKDDPRAREKVHNAATIAGMAFANAFLGICHSMAHKLGGTWHVPHGLANALLITHVIRYNATDAPYRQATFSQYRKPDALVRYAELADMLGLGGATKEEKVVKLIEAVEDLKRQLDVPATIREVVGADKEELYMASTLEMSYQAFDDQCTGANPRYPLVKDLRKMLEEAWTTPILPLSVDKLEFESPSYSCLNMKLEAPSKPASTGAP